MSIVTPYCKFILLSVVSAITYWSVAFGKSEYTLAALPSPQFETNTTAFTYTTGGPFDALAHSLATNTTYCLYDSPSSIKICQEKRRRCFLERFPWCQAYFSQTRIPWKEVPRGDKACPKDDQGRECSGVGVCDYDWGMCQCPAGWRGKGCEIRIRQRCTNGPGSRSGASFGVDTIPVEKLNDIKFNPEDPSHWLKYMVDKGGWTASRCAGFCDDVAGLCYCGLGPYRYKDPPLEAAADALGKGRQLGHHCKLSSNAKGEKLHWGVVSWEQVYGPQGYCMVSENDTTALIDGQRAGDFCWCDSGMYYGPFCASIKEVFCVNNCNGRGWCDRGFCKCFTGWYGSDCARRRAGLSLNDSATVETVNSQGWLKKSYMPPRALGPLLTETVSPINAEAFLNNGSRPEQGGEKGKEEEAQQKEEKEKEKEKEKEEEEGEKKDEEKTGSHLHGRSKGRMRPLIYVYDASEFSSQILQYSRASPACSWRHFNGGNNESVLGFSVYTIETYLHEAMLASEHRTFDPEEADLFYVPIYQTCLSYPVYGYAEQPNFPPVASSNRAMHGSYMFSAAVAYLRNNYPFWNRTGGKDHIFMAFHDEGACYLPKEVYDNSIVLTSWGRMDLNHVSNTGYGADNYSEIEPLKNAKQWREVVGKHPCYDPARHLVIPSLKNPNHYAFSPLLGFPPMKRDILFYARGEMGSRRLINYSRHIRQTLLKLSRKYEWDKKFKIYMMEGEGIANYDSQPFGNSYSHQLARSKFCAVMPGDGFSARFEDAVLHGCIPVIIQDHVHVSFESILDIDSFAIRIPQSALNEHLPYVLLGISDEQVERMQRKLGSVYHRFAYSSGFLLKSELNRIMKATQSWAKQLKQISNGTEEYSWRKGQIFEPYNVLPRKTNAFHTIIQWLKWRSDIIYNPESNLVKEKINGTSIF